MARKRVSISRILVCFSWKYGDGSTKTKTCLAKNQSVSPCTILLLLLPSSPFPLPRRTIRVNESPCVIRRKEKNKNAFKLVKVRLRDHPSYVYVILAQKKQSSPRRYLYVNKSNILIQIDETKGDRVHVRRKKVISHTQWASEPLTFHC